MRRVVTTRLAKTLAVVIALAAAPAGCEPDKNTQGGGKPTAGKTTYEIAVIPKGLTHDFWKSVEAGVRKAEKEINAAGEVTVRALWKGPQKEDERKKQIDYVRNFISRGVAGICLAPLDQDALVSPVKDAMAGGIPVVIFDSGLTGEVGKDFISYVATNNRRGGQLGARRLGQLLGGKGKVILLRYQVGSESTSQREEGFLEVMEKEFPGVEIISSNQHGGGTAQKSKQKSQNLLVRFGDEVDGIFTPNESTTFAMLLALRDAEFAGKVKFVGFDSSVQLVQGLRDGHLHGLVVQNPIKMGYESLWTIVRHLEGKSVAREVDTGVAVVTKENMDRPEMKELHSPDLSRWLGD